VLTKEWNGFCWGEKDHFEKGGRKSRKSSEEERSKTKGGKKGDVDFDLSTGGPGCWKPCFEKE